MSDSVRTMVARVLYPNGLSVYGEVRQTAGGIFRLVRLTLQSATQDGVYHVVYDGTFAQYQGDPGSLYVSLAACKYLEEVPAVIHFRDENEEVSE